MGKEIERQDDHSSGQSYSDRSELKLQLTDGSAELAGALVGSAITLLGGPGAVLIGAGTGVVATRGIKQALDRLFGREKERAEAALAIVETAAQEHVEKNEHPREDGFFEEKDGHRPDADELLEGVIRLAASTYEERKLPLLASIFTEVAFDESTTAGDAQFLVRLADQLTFRQLVAMSILERVDEYQTELGRIQVSRAEGELSPDPALLLELDDLGDRRLIGHDSGDKVAMTGTTYNTIRPMSENELQELALTPAGKQLTRLTQARDLISSEQREEWIERLGSS